MADRLVKMFSTFFYVGYLPMAPGSMASVVGVFISIILADSLFLYCLVFAFVTVIGFRIGDRMEVLVGEKDPSCVVIDEVSGVMLAFFLLPLTPAVMFSAFFLFRAFDMFKIYPVNKFEKLHGGVGIMMDDVIAGLYTNLTMHIAIRLAGVV